ncbi:MAG: hypothetical protein R3Y06_10110 [Faecalibacterium sp.]
MKCPYCSAPLMIEDELCPYCGKENPYFTKHREDIKEFTEEFEETHQEVLQKVTHTSRISIRIIIICVLLVLNLLFFLCYNVIWNVDYWYRDWYTNHNEVQVRATLEAYSDAGDVLGLSEYCDHQISIYGTNIEDYYIIESAARQYTFIYRNLIELTVLQESSYYTTAECAESIAQNLEYYYYYVTPTKYSDPDTFNEEHQATLDMMTEKLEALLEAYLNIPPEEIPALLELSEARRAIAIEEGVAANES